MGLPPPQYIGCKHHILDLVLKHVMDELIAGRTTSPKIGYDFVADLMENYEVLTTRFVSRRKYLIIFHEVCHKSILPSMS